MVYRVFYNSVYKVLSYFTTNYIQFVWLFKFKRFLSIYFTLLLILTQNFLVNYFNFIFIQIILILPNFHFRFDIDPIIIQLALFTVFFSLFDLIINKAFKFTNFHIKNSLIYIQTFCKFQRMCRPSDLKIIFLQVQKISKIAVFIFFFRITKEIQRYILNNWCKPTIITL